MVVVFAALVGVERPGDLATRARALARHADLLAVGVGVAILTLLPQLAYYYRITGRVLLNPYPNCRSRSTSACCTRTSSTSSSASGRASSSGRPCCCSRSPGSRSSAGRRRPLLVPAVAYLVVETWVVASWSIWWYGGSFGMRALVDALPVFALGLAALCEGVRGARSRRALGVAIAVTTLLAVHGMVAYWLKTIPVDEATFRNYLDSFRYW